MHHHTALTLLFATFGLVIYTSKLPSPSVLMPCYVQGATKVYEKASDLTKKGGDQHLLITASDG